MQVRLLRAADAERAVALRRLALTTDGYAFAEHVESDPAVNVEFVRQRLAASGVEASAVVVGAFDPELVGMVGLNRTNAESGDARLWGCYVTPNCRRNGLGRALAERAVKCARQMSVHRVELSIAEAAVAAIRLYESAGFVTVGSNGEERYLAMDID
jgi:ribosomal protein S18 acetylase RimI-like enzyme